MKSIAIFKGWFDELNLFGLTIRASSILCKVWLIFLLSANASIEVIGEYGLFVASIVLLNNIYGLEYYRYTSREITEKSKFDTTNVVLNQFVVHVFMYLAVFPFVWLFFIFDFISWKYFGAFVAISILSHLCQEISRLLIVFGRANQAYWVIFIAHGLWALSLIFGHYYFDWGLGLTFIFQLWFLSSLLGFLFGASFLCFSGRLIRPIVSLNLDWITSGLRISAKFLVAALAFKLIELSDRYFLKVYHGEAAVGTYTILISVSAILYEFVYTGVVVRLTPALLEHSQSGRQVEYASVFRKLRANVVLASLIGSILLLIFMVLLTNIFSLQMADQHKSSFIVLTIGYFMFSLSIIPNYKLYLARDDGLLMRSVLLVFFANVILNFALIPAYGIFGAALATLFSFLLLFVVYCHYSIQSDVKKDA